MARKFTLIVTKLIVFLTAVSQHANAQANTKLSNLVSPTAINQALLPNNNNGRDIGSAAKSWRVMYLDSAIYLKDVIFMHAAGSFNAFVGFQAGKSITTGVQNAAFGYNALPVNTTGSQNTALGKAVLYQNTVGSFNSGSGYQALFSNMHGSFNTASGAYSLYINNTGSYNTANGFESLYSNVDGISNTAYGMRTLRSNIQSFNTAIGSAALYSNTTGDHNTAIGVSVDVATNNLQNATVIGADAIVNASNKVRIGDANITVVESAAGSWTTSDGRFKNNIKENVKGLEFIRLLKPVTYTFDTKKFSEFLLQNYSDSLKKERIAAIYKKDAGKVSEIVQSGFIAQDVAAAVNKSGYNFSGVHAPENPTDNWSLSYEKLVVPLVKAVQELDKKTEEIDALKTEVQQQSQEIKELKQLVQSIVQSKSPDNSNSYLSQNSPNPFKGNTVIPFKIAAGSSTAAIQIIETGSGRVVKTIPVAVNAMQVTINAGLFSTGTYSYALMVDDKLVGTKQMILIK